MAVRDLPRLLGSPRGATSQELAGRVDRRASLMCGIFGVATLSGEIAESHVRGVAAGTRLVTHRGPDGVGSWHDERVALGHRRLAIIDLTESGTQPMVSSSGRYVVSYNGEIYNHRALASRLTASGWRPHGTSDTEVLLAAIDSWGIERTLDAIDGMFAIALYDRRSSRLHLVRDRFGEKPLHVCRVGRMLWFGSELRSFEAVPDLSLTLDPESTCSFFRLGHVPGTETIYSQVQRIRPGERVEYDLATGEEHHVRFWQPRPAVRVDDEELLRLLTSSVATRMVSDRPVGAFLSGGVDSSLVSALAAQVSATPLRTYTMAWEDREYDESAQASAVACAIGSDHTEIRLGRAETVDAVTRLGEVLDEPFADSSLLATHLVARETRRHVVVALSGDGGDELFGGYNRHRWLPRVAKIQRLPSSVRTPAGLLVKSAAGAIDLLLRPVSPRRRPRLVGDKVNKLARALVAGNLAESYRSTLTLDPNVGSPINLEPDITESLRSNGADASLLGLRLADLRHYLPDDVLTKVDRATMACALESRTPFLQPDIAAAALAMSHHELMDRHGGKAPLRRLLGRLVPGVSFTGSKTGFGIPVASLLRGELRPLLRDAASEFERRGAPVSIPWTVLIDRLDGGDDSVQHRLWSLLAFELWAGGKHVKWADEESR